MHEPIRARLEAYLENPEAIDREFRAHLAACQECVGDLERMREHARMVRALRPDFYVEPPAGLYARLMERIESEAKPPVWSMLRDTAFGWRLALASAAMALLMAGYLVSTDPADRDSIGASPNALTADAASPDQARNSVLVTLASFPE